MPTTLKIADLEFSPCLALPFIVVIMATACAASASVSEYVRRRPSLAIIPTNRHNGLNGLRGILALGVFLHHDFTAYGYFTRGQWNWSSSALFNHLGQSTVALFFMLTGYLFSERLLRSAVAQRDVGWSSLYISRFARLVPLYAAVVSAVVISVFLLDWTLREPVATIARELACWYLFVIPGRPDINRLPETWTLIAGVNWSLKYEWYFYIGLPLMYWPLRLFAGPKGTRIAIALLVLLLIAGIAGHRDITATRLYLLHFACGILAALISRDDELRRWISSHTFPALGILALGLLGLVPNAHNAMAVGLTLVFFLTIVGGYTVGGLLTRPAIIWLGEISYGLYLIHGLVIFWTLHCLTAVGVLAKIDLLTYTAIVAAMTVVLVGLASFSYVYLERPVIDWARGFSRLKKMPRVSARPGQRA